MRDFFVVQAFAFGAFFIFPNAQTSFAEEEGFNFPYSRASYNKAKYRLRSIWAFIFYPFLKTVFPTFLKNKSSISYQILSFALSGERGI